MSSTEHELRALAAFVDLPAERDLAPAVRARLAGAAVRRRRASRSSLAAALVAVAVAFAVPPARSAILRFFHLRGVSIEHVDTLPEVPADARSTSASRSRSPTPSERAAARSLRPADAGPR